MKKRSGCMVRVGEWWTLRRREKVIENGTIRSINRAVKIARVSPDCKTKRAAWEMVAESFPAKKAPPTKNMLLAEFVENIYLVHARAHLRPSTADAYRNLWTLYL